MKMQLNKKGFTLIELLVVIAIIGLLSTLAVVSLGNARAKSRDTKRVADIKQIQTALELYFADQNGYPAGTALVLGGAETSDTLSSTNGFAGAAAGTTYMGQVPANQGPGGADYVYDQQSSGISYTLSFELEGVTGGLEAGAHTASPAGIQ